MKKFKIEFENEHSCLMGFISWQRLAREGMRGVREIQKHETITHFDVSEAGIHYGIRTVLPLPNKRSA